MDDNQAKEILTNDIEEFKKYLKDCSSLVQSAIQFRTATMALHESGNKFMGEIKKLGERYSGNKWAARFLQVADAHEVIEKARYEWQTQLWDQFILPMMNSAEPDQKELASTEKRLKSLLSQIKKEHKKKKKNDDSQTGDELPKAEDVVKYFWLWENHKFHKHLSYMDSALDHEKEYYRICHDTLRKDLWKSAVQNPPESIPENFGEKGVTLSPSISSNHSQQQKRGSILGPDTPTTPSPANSPLVTSGRSSVLLGGENLPVNNKTFVKCGYLEKISSNIMKSKKKYWFMLSNENVLEYFTSDSSVGKESPIGTINLNECQELSIDQKKKSQFSFKGKDGKEFTFSSDPKDFDAWYKLIQLVVPEHNNVNFNRKSTAGILKRAPSLIIAEGEPMLKLSDKESTTSSTTDVEPSNKEAVPSGNENPPDTSAATLPPPLKSSQEDLQDPSVQWTSYVTDEGQEYWYNVASGESTWEKPY